MSTAYEEPTTVIAIINQEKVDLCAISYLLRHGAIDLEDIDEESIKDDCKNFRKNLELALDRNNIKYTYSQIVHTILTARQPEGRGDEVTIALLIQKDSKIRTIGILPTSLILSADVGKTIRNIVARISKEME